MRILEGKFANRDLTSPADFRVRPTAERVRGMALDLVGARITGARVLDLFAGTGAFGIEAISRGATSADFVEFRPGSLHALRANVAAFRLRDRARIFKRDAVLFAAALPADRYDVAFADPPYASKMLDMVIASWQRVPFSRLLVVEHARTHLIPAGARRVLHEDTALTLYEHSPVAVAGQ